MSRPALFAIVEAMLLSSAARAQDIHEAQHPMRVRATRVAILPDSMTVGGIRDSRVIVFSDGAGRYYEVRMSEERIFVFDSAGHPLGSFGRRGGGPGEFRSTVATAMADAGDSIRVFESG